MFIGLIQMVVHTVVGDANEIIYVMTICASLLTLQGLVKSIVVLTNVDRIMALQVKIEVFFKTNFGALDEKREQFFKFICKWGKRSFLVNLFLINVIFGVKFLTLIVSICMRTVPENSFVFLLYWPFNIYDFPMFANLYHWFLGNLSELPLLLVDQMIILTGSSLIACFDRFGDDIKDTINKSCSRSFCDTKECFARCVDNHNQLFAMCNELNSVFEIAIFVKIAQVSLLLCILGFVVIVSFLFKLF